MTRNNEFLGQVKERVRHLVPMHDGSKEACILDDLAKEIKEDLQYALGELGNIGDNIAELRKEVPT